MKTVTALIRPEMLNDVIYALHATEGVRGASVSEGRGFGSWRLEETDRELQSEEDNFKPHTRIEVVCEDTASDGIRAAIIANAATGKPGDGIVVVSDAESVHKIRTGEIDTG